MLRRFFTTLLTGLLAILPLVITLALIVYVAGWLARMLGPGSGFGKLLSSLTGGKEDLLPLSVAYLASIALIIGILWLIGRFTSSYVAQGVSRNFERLIARIPLVNTIYSSVDQVVDLFKEKEKSSGAGMESAVLFRYANLLMIGMLSTHEPIPINGVVHYMVFAMNTPVPSGGFTYLVPEQDLIHVNLSTEEVTRIIVSLGALAGRIMNDKHPLEASAPPAAQPATPAAG
jgi:uncharacterized membrane protein